MTQPIVGVASSITAFLGKAVRGPVDRATEITSFVDFERTFGGLRQDLMLGYAVRDFFANGGTHAVVVRLYKQPGAAAAKATIDVANLGLEAADEGQWGNQVRVRVDRKAQGDAEAAEAAECLGLTAGDLFDLTVFDGATIESFPNLTSKESARRADRVLAAESRLVRVTTQLPADALPPAHAGASTDADVWTDDTKSTSASSNGNAAAADSAALVAADYEGSAADATGLHALDHADLFNLLCITADARGGDVPDEAYGAALDYCVQRRAMLIVDPKAAWTDAATARAGVGKMGLTGDRARNAAIYFPRVRESDAQLGGQVDTFAPSGMVAGVLARTDAERGVWESPAGTHATLTGAVGLSIDLTDADNGLLGPRGINGLRSLPGVGLVVWGARTMRGTDAAPDEFRYLAGAAHRPVRRGEPVPRPRVGRVRTERRTAVGADPPHRRRLHVRALRAGRVPGDHAPRRLLGAVRRGHDDGARHHRRHRERRRRVRTPEAGRVRGDPAAAARRADPAVIAPARDRRRRTVGDLR